MEVFADVILPPRVIRAGISGKNRRNNTRTTNQAGFQHVNVNWLRSLREYQLGIVDRDVAAWATIEGLHEITEGGAYGFLLEDPKDHAVTLSQGRIGDAGVGQGVPTAQLVKAYGVVGSSRVSLRRITRLASATLRRGNDPYTGATYDAATGAVTMPPDAQRAIVAVTSGADTQVQLASAIGALGVGGRLYLSGVGGAGATLLNGRAHVITGIAGATYSLETDTTGATLTASGTAAKYAQPDELLRWVGEFYVPVHFVNDDIDWSLTRPGPTDEARLVSGDSITVMEVRE